MAYVPVDYQEKLCNWCENVFKPNTKHQNFCSRKCYKKHGKKNLGHSNGKSVVVKDGKSIHRNTNSYRKYKKLICECCGLIPEHPCQLDVDHIDGNHSNNCLENLQTLCANCHRIKTARQLGWCK